MIDSNWFSWLGIGERTHSFLPHTKTSHLQSANCFTLQLAEFVDWITIQLENRASLHCPRSLKPQPPAEAQVHPFSALCLCTTPVAMVILEWVVHAKEYDQSHYFHLRGAEGSGALMGTQIIFPQAVWGGKKREGPVLKFRKYFFHPMSCFAVFPWLDFVLTDHKFTHVLDSYCWSYFQ